MNRDFQKVIYTRTRLKNKYCRDPSRQNELAYKKQRNLCVSIRRKSITNYLNKFTDKGLETNKSFWKFIKPFLTNKGTLTGCDITIVDGKKIISDDFELAKTFNKHINTVEINSGFKPLKITNQSKDDLSVIDEIIRTYQDHPSVNQIKNVITTSNTPKPIYFSFEPTNPVEATGFDKIPPKFVKLSAEVLSTPLSIAINNSLKYGVFPDDAKNASVIPLDKGKPNTNEISNFRPVSILNTFSKIYEKVIKDQLVSGLDKYPLPFISAHRKGYSTQHLLTRLVEEWRKRLDNNYIVGAILMDLSKAFDCILHDLIIAKLAAYGLDDTALQLIFSYLKNRKPCARINNTYSNFENIITGVPQGSIAGSLLFDFPINDLFFFIESSSIHNFTDDNTLSAWANTISDLINKFESDSNIAIEWFKMNKMIVNPDKFQAILLNKKRSDLTNTNFQVDNQVIKSVPSVELLGIQIDDKLHISKICKSAANQLNALIRLKQFFSFNVKEVLINSYNISNFNYCPLVWMFSSTQSLNKIENLQN